MPKVYFLDVTNRDGVQTSRISLSKLQKTMLNYYLAQMKIHQSEIGFPFAKHEQNYIRANLALQQKGVFGDMVLEGWCRAIPQDVEAGLPTGIKDYNLSISTSDQMIQNKFMGKLDREAILEEMGAATVAAQKAGAHTIGVNAEDASRTDLDYLTQFARAAKDAGADRFRYCDTIGYDSTDTIYKRIRHVAKEVGIDIELHCHNDLGMAVANSVAGARGAIDGGMDAYINTTVLGIGERAGQADLVSTILAFRHAQGLQEIEIADDVDLTVAWKLSNYIAHALRLPIPINQVGVGANAFAHESGIHADGALKDHRNYEIYDLDEVGRGQFEKVNTGRVITTGEYGGINGFRYVYKENLGMEFKDTSEAQRALELVQYANAHNQMPLTDDELRFIATYPDEVAQILTVNP